MGEDCIDNKNNDLGDTDFPDPLTISNYNLTDYGTASAYWDGNTYVSRTYHGDPNVTMRKKIDTILERIQVIERTLLTVLDEIRTIKLIKDREE